MRILFIVYAFLFFVLVSACGHKWNPDLLEKDIPDWPELDRVAFLSHSPWAVSGSSRVENWGSETNADLEVTAQFLTPYFIEKRSTLKEIARTRDWMNVQPMVTFDEAISVNTYFRDGQILVKGVPPHPLDHKLLFPSRSLPDGIGLFPSGPYWLDFFHDQLQLERSSVNPRDMLEDRLDFENKYYIDLYFMPLIKSHRVGARVVNPVRCLDCVVGRVLEAEISLRRDDGEKLKAAAVVVLWQDINETWRKAVWRRGKMSVMGIPTAARLIFPRKTDGKVWLENAKKIKLELAVPPEECKSYSSKSGGMKWKSELEFDLENMAQAEKKAAAEKRDSSAAVQPAK